MEKSPTNLFTLTWESSQITDMDRRQKAGNTYPDSIAQHLAALWNSEEHKQLCRSAPAAPAHPWAPSLPAAESARPARRSAPWSCYCWRRTAPWHLGSEAGKGTPPAADLRWKSRWLLSPGLKISSISPQLPSKPSADTLARSAHQGLPFNQGPTSFIKSPFFD